MNGAIGSCFAVALTFLFAFGCGSDSQSEPTSSTATTAIDTNNIDNDDPHRNADVLVRGPTDSTHTANCSGTLITPVRVITANHCVTGDNTLNITPSGGGWGIDNPSVRVTIGVDPANPDDDISVRYPSGQHVRQNASISAPEDLPIDVAVLELT